MSLKPILRWLEEVSLLQISHPIRCCKHPVTYEPWRLSWLCWPFLGHNHSEECHKPRVAATPIAIVFNNSLSLCYFFFFFLFLPACLPLATLCGNKRPPTRETLNHIYESGIQWQAFHALTCPRGGSGCCPFCICDGWCPVSFTFSIFIHFFEDFFAIT